jgi:integrase
MPRPSKTQAIDYTQAHTLSHGLLERATCPDGMAFVLVKDADQKGLRLRVTPAGGKFWQFEARIAGRLFTRSLGAWPAVPIGDAQTSARDLRTSAAKKIDPRELERQAAAEAARVATEVAVQAAAAQATAAAQALTVGDVWTVYLEARRPHWGARHYADHATLTRAGGEQGNKGTRGRGVTIAGPLHPLLGLALRDLTAPAVEAWAAREAKTRPTSARLGWRCLKAFLSWCAEQPEYAPLLPSTNPAKTKKARQTLGKAGIKQDALLREQLPAWFAAVCGMSNPVAAAYLQTLLLTGARPGEVLALRWDDINTQWRGLTIRDKVEGLRVIPLTPYVHGLLAALPRRNDFVFASNPRGGAKHAAPISTPNTLHTAACTVAGIEGLTLHGLRRSFKSLTEWLECPAGVVAQLMGHKPSATAEKHYTVRPLDLLRVHHEKIEAWILEQAGVQFDRASEPGRLRVVAG